MFIHGLSLLDRSRYLAAVQQLLDGSMPAAAPTPSAVAEADSSDDEVPDESADDESMQDGPAKQPAMAGSGAGAEAPVKVDIQARLSDRYAEVRFPGTPLVDAVRLMSRLSTVQIALDLDAMANVGTGRAIPSPCI